MLLLMFDNPFSSCSSVNLFNHFRVMENLLTFYDGSSTDEVMFLGGLMQTGAEYIQIYGNEYRVR